MIRKSNEINVMARRRILLYGVPGIAKSTTALSAPSPLMVDTDRGWDRVPAQFRKGDYIQPDTYEELLGDLTAENVAHYETIIFDTGGALLNLMKAWAIKRDPKDGQKDGMTLSMRGYGTVGREFERLMSHCFYTLNKNVVVIFHAKEDMDGESKVYRIDVEGQTKNNIWKSMDLGGFMEAYGDKRVVGFSPSDRYFAKGTHGISGVMELPNVMKPGVANDFLANLFGRITQNVQEETDMAKKYEELMNRIRSDVEGITDAATASAAFEKIKGYEHYFGSKTEAWYLLKAKADGLGLNFDKASGAFVAGK
jgi:hypothetical protein